MNFDVAIHRTLRQVGVPANLKGYRHIQEAVAIVFEDPKALDEATKRLYPAIANACNTTPSRVERTMRYAIQYAFTNTDPEAIQSVFGNTYNAYSHKLSNTQFIAGLVQYIKTEVMV